MAKINQHQRLPARYSTMVKKDVGVREKIWEWGELTK